jgi:hypothetical protein
LLLRRPLTDAGPGIFAMRFQILLLRLSAVGRLDLHATQSIANTATRLQWQTRGESAAYRIAVNLLVCCSRGEAL